MKEITAILLILIAVIGIISIIIVKLYYRDKEKDDEKERLEEFLNSTKTDYEDERPKKVRRTSRNREHISEAQRYANTINSQSKIDLQDARRVREALASEDLFENENVGGTTALLRQRANAMENAPKKQTRKVRKPQAEVVPKKQVPTKKIKRTPESVKTKMEEEEEVKVFQEPIKPEHTATIASARAKEAQPKPRQVPMTEKQKEFIEKEANKLIVDDTDSAVKVVKSIKPADTIEEIKESAKIEEKDEIVEKAEKDTADFIKKIEEAKEDAEEKIADATEEAKEELVETKEEAKEEVAETKEEIKEKIAKTVAETEEIKEKIAKTVADVSEEVEEELAETKDEIKEELVETKEEAKEKIAETVAETKEIKEKIAETADEAKETPSIESTIEKIKQSTEEKLAETSEEAEEVVGKVEEEAVEAEPKVEEVKSTITESASKVSDKISQVAERVYNDDLHLILNKGQKEEEVDDTPENEFVTINSDTETAPTSNELINNAIQSIRNFRKPNVPENLVIEEIKDDIVPDDYAQDLGDGIEYIGDTITITPIHEEEIDLANNQPNEDVDKIYKEINEKSYNKTDDEELSESFEDVTDETSQEDANVYTEEDYKKIEAAEKEKKRRAENTKKILGSKGISEDELRRRAEAKAKSKRTRKAAPAEEPVEDGQKRLMVHKVRNDVEEVYINGTLFELKVGQIVIFEINGENYSSQILRLKPGYIGVRYRSKKIWVKSNTVKKILK